MICSMTGYGEGVRMSKDGFSVSVRMKSVNGKSLRFSLRLPEFLSTYEREVENILRSHINRGTVEVSAEAEVPGVYVRRLDEKLLKHYASFVKRLVGESDVKVTELLGLPGVIRREERKDIEKVRTLFEGAVSDALKMLLLSRKKEGASLYKEMRRLLSSLKSKLRNLRRHTSRDIERIAEKICERLKTVLGEKVSSNGAALREAALIAERCDVSEELERLEIHIAEFEDAMKRGGTVGLRLDFLTQEMQREAATIAAKYFSSSLSLDVVDVRTLIASLRQQVQNIE
ncbi:MAG: YicC family protein [Planctomycetota bacterium]|nr:YicC family protein [Planctomycetota bacterium]